MMEHAWQQFHHLLRRLRLLDSLLKNFQLQLRRRRRRRRHLWRQVHHHLLLQHSNLLI